jgi:hypothetical protein
VRRATLRPPNISCLLSWSWIGIMVCLLQPTFPARAVPAPPRRPRARRFRAFFPFEAESDHSCTFHMLGRSHQLPLGAVRYRAAKCDRTSIQKGSGRMDWGASPREGGPPRQAGRCEIHILSPLSRYKPLGTASALGRQIAAGGRASRFVREYRRPYFPNGPGLTHPPRRPAPVPGRAVSWRERPRDVGPRPPDGWKFTERVAEFRYPDTTPLAGSAPTQRGPHAQ